MRTSPSTARALPSTRSFWHVAVPGVGLLCLLALAACDDQPAREGQRCSKDSDCAAGLICRVDPASWEISFPEEETLESCQPLAGLREFCTDPSDCVEGLTCDCLFEDAYCERACLIPVGGACTVDWQDGLHTHDCASVWKDVACFATPDGTGTCAKTGQSGHMCGDAGGAQLPCDYGLWCDTSLTPAQCMESAHE